MEEIEEQRALYTRVKRQEGALPDREDVMGPAMGRLGGFFGVELGGGEGCGKEI